MVGVSDGVEVCEPESVDVSTEVSGVLGVEIAPVGEVTISGEGAGAGSEAGARDALCPTRSDASWSPVTQTSVPSDFDTQSFLVCDSSECVTFA